MTTCEMIYIAFTRVVLFAGLANWSVVLIRMAHHHSKFGTLPIRYLPSDFLSDLEADAANYIVYGIFSAGALGKLFAFVYNDYAHANIVLLLEVTDTLGVLAGINWLIVFVNTLRDDNTRYTLDLFEYPKEEWLQLFIYMTVFITSVVYVIYKGYKYIEPRRALISA